MSYEEEQNYDFLIDYYIARRSHSLSDYKMTWLPDFSKEYVVVLFSVLLDKNITQDLVPLVIDMLKISDFEVGQNLRFTFFRRPGNWRP